jgi:hypothetical protein
MTLHTGEGCSISRSSDMLGSVSTDNCDINAPGQGNNEGCQITTQDSRSYGKGFNDNNGGVYATEITSSFINIFFFPRGSIPSDISGASPDPSGWGKPMAVFKGDCDIAQTFKKMQIVFTNTFCGDWAGNVWDSGSCASKADTCVDYVKNNPNDFEDAYWSVNSLKVYQHGEASASSQTYSAESTSFYPSLASSTWSQTSTTESSTLSQTSATESSAWSQTSTAEYSTWSQASTAESSDSSMTRPHYSTKPSGIVMPSGVSHDPWTANEGSYGASPTALPETSGNDGDIPSHHWPSVNIAVVSTTSSAVAAEISTESRQRPEGWSSRGLPRHNRHSERAASHLKQHKRHSSRRL